MKRRTYTAALCAALAVVGIGAAVWGAGAAVPVKAAAPASPSPTPKVSPSTEELNRKDFTSLEARQSGEYWYNDDPSTYLGASDEMRAVLKVMAPQEYFELQSDVLYADAPGGTEPNRYAESTVVLHKSADGTPVTESGKPAAFTAESQSSEHIQAPSGLPIDCTVTDVRVSDRLEYGLTPEDDTFIPWTVNEADEGRYAWLTPCALDENGVLTAPRDYAFVYLTVHAAYNGKFDSALLRMGSAELRWYNPNGYLLDSALTARNKTELRDGAAQVPYNNEDASRATDVVLKNGEARDLLYVFLVPKTFVYPITDDASAVRDGVHDYRDIVKYYGVGTYEEENPTYTFELTSYGSRTAQLDLTEFVKAYFKK